MNSIEIFDIARIKYRTYGIVKGLETEFTNYKRHHKDWGKCLPLLLPAIEKQKTWRAGANGEFRPRWKNFQTWINQRCWEDELPDDISQETKTKLFPISGRTCGLSKCPLPAVYKDTSGAYDQYSCTKHLPEKVKELYE